jgi:DNA-binding NtrC family response regulator
MMISDVRMPGLTGLETLRRARQDHATLPVLLVTAYADIRDAVGAMRDGAVNYLAKPIDLDELLASVQQATGISKSAPLRYDEDRQLPRTSSPQPADAGALPRRFAHRAVRNRVLITGESGVGKEVVADVIHAWSPRAAGPLVKVNCAAIPERCWKRTVRPRKGLVHRRDTPSASAVSRMANGGTIFWMKSPRCPAAPGQTAARDPGRTFPAHRLQPRIQTNARILAASNRNLEEEVKAGRFREDLFYRLNVVELNVPPLRERREDILPLANLFIAGIHAKGRALFRPSPPAWNAIPGRATCANCATPWSAPRCFPAANSSCPNICPRASAPPPAARPPPIRRDAERLEEIERQAILQALRNHNFNRTETAKALGISRRALLYKLHQLLNPDVRVVLLTACDDFVAERMLREVCAVTFKNHSICKILPRECDTPSTPRLAP